MKIVIIGGGTSGVAVATKLRRRNEYAEIVILEKNQEFAVIKCAFPYFISGTIKDKDDLRLASPEQMWRIFRIKVKLGHNVIEINRNKKTIKIKDQTPEHYDKLIIATGAIQLHPDIKGILGENIFTLNSLTNLERIKKYYLENKVDKILILGANKNAIELAEAFQSLGAKILLVTKEKHMLQNFDNDMVAIIEKHLIDKGIDLYLKHKVSALESNVVHFKNGKSYNYDMAIIATNSVPDIQIPVLSDIELGQDGGIKVNKYMQTNDGDIYACGKTSEMLNLVTDGFERIENSAIETKQARVIANHINEIYTPMVGFKDCDITKIGDFYAGICGASEEKLMQQNIPYQKVYLRQLNHSIFYPNPSPLYLKLLFAEDGLILGIQIIGAKGVIERINAVNAQMQHNAKVTDLAFGNIAYLPQLSQPKDALNNIGALAEEVRNHRLKFITTGELKKDTFIIDVCSPNEFANYHLADAVNLPLPAIRDNLKTIPHNREIAIYSNSDYGAYLAYQILRLNDFQNLYLISN